MASDWFKSHPSLHNILNRIVPKTFQRLENDHPARIVVRTYALSLSLSLGPALIPLLAEGRTNKKRRIKLASVLQKELSVSGFAFAMTTAAGGGAALEYYWKRFTKRLGQAAQFKADANRLSVLSDVLLRGTEVSPLYETFICNAITSLLAILLMHSRRRSSQTRRADIPLTVPIDELGDRKSLPTLDLTLLLLVRALDAFTQRFFHQHAEKVVDNKQAEMYGESSVDRKRLLRKKVAVLTDKLDAFIFWAASARIMWCFFYRPERLPRSYVRWIGALANVDERLLEALRRLRKGAWRYGKPESHALLSTMAADLGYPPSWGDSLHLPEYGGKVSEASWKALGVHGRTGVGGLPCEIVHGGVGSSVIPGGVGGSCAANSLARGGLGFLEALALYTPVHFLPVLLTRPKALLSSVVLKKLILSLLRSSLFLSVFISSIWSAVCFTRSWGIARLFPRLSHNFIDGPFGCIMAGCLVCGGSIWIEQGRRRGEIALYVLPRALRSLLSESWLRSGTKSLMVIERLAFALSLASIITASRHCPETLRGLSRWTAMFILKGMPRG
ncbi:hypothetical protein ACEPAH_619 [Sanghuangporus vaninii]